MEAFSYIMSVISRLVHKTQTRRTKIIVFISSMILDIRKRRINIWFNRKAREIVCRRLCRAQEKVAMADKRSVAFMTKSITLVTNVILCRNSYIATAGKKNFSVINSPHVEPLCSGHSRKLFEIFSHL